MPVNILVISADWLHMDNFSPMEDALPWTTRLIWQLENRDVTKFKFEFERWRISNNFSTFDIRRRMLKLPSRQMWIHGVYIPQM